MKRNKTNAYKLFLVIIILTILELIFIVTINILLSKFISIIEFIIAISSFIISLISIYIIYKEFIDGSFCTKLELKKGVKDIACKINTISPTKIVLIGDNTNKLFQYVQSKLNIAKNNIIKIDIFNKFETEKYKFYSKYNINMIETYKFWIIIDDTLFNVDDKILIFDDVAITSNTIVSIYNYFTEKLNIKATTTLTFAADYTAQRTMGQPIDTHMLTKINNDCHFPWR